MQISDSFEWELKIRISRSTEEKKVVYKNLFKNGTLSAISN